MWNIIFYEKEDGTIPVREFIDSIPPKHRVKTIWAIEMLEDTRVSLGMPYSKHVDDELWEICIQYANNSSRIFYFVPVENDIVLLHGFDKKLLQTPRREVNTALQYLSDYERRYG